MFAMHFKSQFNRIDKIMSQPLVSVIVPSYNHEKFISEAIQSIIDQDYPNIELIIIDDGSQDNSVNIIESFREACENRFIRFEFKHRPNKRLCATLNEALEWVQGEYLCTVASDDIWVKEKTSIQVKYLENHPETVAVFGTITLIDQDSVVIKEKPRKFKRHYFEDIFLHDFYIPTPTGMSRTKAIKDTDGYNENIRIEDWLMWLRLAEKGESLDCLPISLAFYRHHKNNLSSKTLWMHEGRIETIKFYRHHKKYNKAIKNIYYIALDEIDKINLALISKALIDVPSFVLSLKFWKKVFTR